MKSKYLRDINCERKNYLDKERRKIHKEEIKKYGISSEETWNLDISFIEFIYVTFKMYNEYNCIDTHFQHFFIDNEEWDMQKGIDYIIDETEKCLISYRDNFSDTKIPEKIYDVLKQLIPLMWW